MFCGPGQKGNACRHVKDFRELKVWQKAHELTLAVYRDTATFPREELYGLLRPADYENLAPRATEPKRMLTALMQKLNAER